MEINATFIGWMVTLLFIIILIGGFFVGFWRGLKRSTANMVISIIGLILAFFITPVVTNAIMGIQVSYNGEMVTLETLILQMLLNMEGVSTMIENNPNLQTLILNLPKALANTLIFVLLTIAVECVLYVIYKILAVTIFKVKKDTKKHRTLGGVVGLVKTFIITIVAVMPLSSLIGLASTMTTSEDYNITTKTQIEATASESSGNIITDNLPKEAVAIINGLENNIMFKLSGFFGLDNAMFDYYSGVDIEGEKVYIRAEIENAYKIFDFGYQLQAYDLKDIDYSKINYDKVIASFDTLTNSALFKKVISQTLADLIVNYDNYSFLAQNQFIVDNTEIMQAIGDSLQVYIDEGKTSEYFRHDLLEIVDSVKTVAQSGMIDEILTLENLDVKGVATIITNQYNIDDFTSGLNGILNAHVVRASITNLAERGLEQLLSGIDAIAVSTADWTEDDWKELSTSVTSIIRDFGDIAKEVDVLEVINDPTILLGKNGNNENYDISFIASKLGSLIDNLRANKLLKNSENQPVIDTLLADKKIVLPTEDVYDNNGEIVTISNYTELFNFISPSLVKMRDENIYDIVTNEESATSKITNLANIISTEGKKTLLSDVILPLYQVEPTKSLIIDNLTQNLESNLLNFANLTTYQEWKKDLNYISNMLITLNEYKIGEDSYLTLALNDNIDAIMDDLTSEKVNSTFLPILYAKSTTAIKDKLFANIKSQIDNFTGLNATLSIAGVTFIEDSSENQAREVCEVVKKLISVNSAIDSGETIKTMDKTILGELLNIMKLNSYRTTLDEKTEEGIFKDAFIKIMTKFKSEYQTEVEYIEANPDILSELGVDSLGEENYPYIDYALLLEKIAEAESQI